MIFGVFFREDIFCLSDQNFRILYFYIEGSTFWFKNITGWFDLGLASFLKSSIRLLRLSKKPDRSELWLSIKISFLGILAIGLIGFVVKLLANFIMSSFPMGGA